MKPPVFSRLSRDDQILWKRVAETTTPLSPQRGQVLKQQMQRLMDETAAPVDPSVATARGQTHPVGHDGKLPRPQQFQSQRASQGNNPVPQRPIVSHPIDKPVLKKLSKGRQPIDSRIDLHGMTQERAQFALFDFLQMAQRANYRIVLVITGKGNQGQGVLKTNVPRWLEQHRFKSFVNGVQPAHPAHGGEGAFYVRIRKTPARTTGKIPGKFS